MKISDTYGMIKYENGKLSFDVKDNDDFLLFSNESNYVRAIYTARTVEQKIKNGSKAWVIEPISVTDNTFMCIDVETANADPSSICQIGIAVFKNGQLTDTWQSLINPQQEFDDFNIRIHGITAESVSTAPTLTELTELLATQYFKHYPATSYGHFDRTAFDKALPEILNIDWLDITTMVRRTWHEFSRKGYGLANVSSHLGIDLKQHHNALSDAITAGHVLIAAFSQNGLSIHEWQNGILPKSKWQLEHSANNTPDPNSEGHLFGKSIVFTGELSMPRPHLEKLAAQSGLAPKTGVSSKTDYLVNGVQIAHNIKDGMSSKLKKALSLQESGNPIQIITEQDFFELLEKFDEEN